MRIATGGFYHETNFFGNVFVTPEMMDRFTFEGDVYFEAFRNARHYRGGAIDEAEELGVELIPVYMVQLSPTGPITRESAELARDNLVNKLWEAYEKQPFDGIALTMHGAAAAYGYPDVEGEILRAIREKFGPDMPIGMVLDLHGNISEEMVQLSDILIGVKCYPHTDEYEAGRIMLNQLHDMIENNYRPCKKLIKLPWHLAPGLGVTLSGGAHEVQQLCFKLEQENDELMQISFFHGFPYADIDIAGVSIVAMAKTQQTADDCAFELAEYAWQHRRDFDAPINSAEKAVDLALEAYDGSTVLINEGSDNPGGGTPGDGTHLLRELIKRDVPSAFGFIYDPEVALLASKAGVGSTISCLLGGKTDDLHGDPIELTNAYVKCISDGKFVRKSVMGRGIRSSLGLTACLEVGNVSIIVAGVRTQTFDECPFLVAGVDWSQKQIVALKSTHHFKGWWKDHVKTIIPCDSPGIHSADLSAFDFKHANKSFYPLDPDTVWVK